MNDLNTDENLIDIAQLLGITGDVRHDARWKVYAADAGILMSSALGATIIRTLGHFRQWLLAHDERNRTRDSEENAWHGKVLLLQAEVATLKADRSVLTVPANLDATFMRDLDVADSNPRLIAEATGDHSAAVFGSFGGQVFDRLDAIMAENATLRERITALEGRGDAEHLGA